MCIDSFCFFFQAEDGIRDLVRSRGLGDVYKRQALYIVDINRGIIQHSTYMTGYLREHIEKHGLDKVLSLIHI